MKLNPRQIGDFLARPQQSRGALIYGPDEGGVRELRSRLLKALGGDAEIVELTDAVLKDDPARLADELGAYSLLGGSRIVLLPDASDRVAALLPPLIEGEHAGNWLIALAGELTPRSKLRLLFEHSPHLAALPCYRDEGASLAQLIRQHCQDAGFRLAPDALQYLAAHLGGDRAVTRSELDKLCLYAEGSELITLEMAQDAVGDSSAQRLDALCHAVCAGNSFDAMQLWARSLDEGVSEVALLRMLQSHLGRVANMQRLMAAGDGFDTACKKNGVFFKAQGVMREQLKLWPGKRIAQAQERLLQLERSLKGAPLPPDLLMAQSLLRLSRFAAGRASQN